MTLHIEFGAVRMATNAGLHPVEAGNALSSETLTVGGTSTEAAPSPPASHSAVAVTVTAEVSGWIGIGPSPSASGNPRRRIRAGQTRSFVVAQGDRVAWLPG
jgi:hypothetical protein